MQIKNRFYFSMSGSIQTNTPFGTILEIAYLANGCSRVLYNYLIINVEANEIESSQQVCKTHSPALEHAPP